VLNFAFPVPAASMLRLRTAPSSGPAAASRTPARPTGKTSSAACRARTGPSARSPVAIWRFSGRRRIVPARNETPGDRSVVARAKGDRTSLVRVARRAPRPCPPTPCTHGRAVGVLAVTPLHSGTCHSGNRCAFAGITPTACWNANRGTPRRALESWPSAPIARWTSIAVSCVPVVAEALVVHRTTGRGSTAPWPGSGERLDV